ncbi:MAG: phosphate transport system regulatory protein PhoU [Omnitrophica WOR_2 bacterium GWF2_43_52]|nr:MAG: phosphate transport system regulatory protein PhoU [Omnitrophica WOR_2 bacterium GWC2_44_8]OGX20739.1 MAG: phosphate transport system regulatory protein PhoU [Omnitrophica WOR_2 bacterium GWF2_43_52]HAH19760.1 phosphate transport system regulatory protein PhoU [Candidatus Omnitrophota bacterium]HBG63385.1 phosphate transport system regulatory protein PhoU [Candidatus Omnitrophota bacterium]
MERIFDEELKQLRQYILTMASLVEEAIFKSVEALKQRDKSLAEAVIASDKKIDELENKIDEFCLDLIALRQPVAQDLRFITMAMQSDADLERMADLAVDIAQRAEELIAQPPLKPLIDIPKLAEIAQKMVKEAIDAFINKDVELAKKVMLADREADALRDLVQKELIYDYMVKDGTTAPRAVPLILVTRHLERICDHATNIAEDVIYMTEAKMVRHHPEKL